MHAAVLAAARKISASGLKINNAATQSCCASPKHGRARAGNASCVSYDRENANGGGTRALGRCRADRRRKKIFHR